MLIDPDGHVPKPGFEFKDWTWAQVQLEFDYGGSLREIPENFILV